VISDCWLRCEHKTLPLCFAVAFQGERIVYGAPYAMAIVRRRGLHDVERFRNHLERSGFRCSEL
jgi:hypothetical protein